MKYMTFNSSCSYAGLANLLMERGIDVEDRDIALDMGLPYYFEHEHGVYAAGPMLQGKRWFDVYLRPMGMEFTEVPVGRAELPAYLRKTGCAMLGIIVSPGKRHAVVYTGTDGRKLCFINNKWRESPEPESFKLMEDELVERLDGSGIVGTVTSAKPEGIDKKPLLQRSLDVLSELEADIGAFCVSYRGPEELMVALDALFRPILLDGITMLTLIGQKDTADKLRAVQTRFLGALRTGEWVKLDERLDLPALFDAMGEYRELICEKLR